ncbi:hypothetical protein [Palleronia salina]|uniref:hypothetical protein n=1 Tax=Palleronia salina TaxID=313368 RepID=UPI0011148868|nr:hypothetical protein [Palleronia salina]
MFNLFGDRRTKQLDQVINLIGTSSASNQAVVLHRLKAASLHFTEAFPQCESFEELKFALRPDQCEAMASKAEDLVEKVRVSRQGDEIDELVFRLLAASLRHKAGAKWVLDKQSRFIDNMIRAAEGNID